MADEKQCPKCNIENAVDPEGNLLPHKEFLSASWCISPTDYFGTNPIREFPLRIIDQLESAQIASVEDRFSSADIDKYTAEIKQEMKQLRFYWNFVVDQFYRE